MFKLRRIGERSVDYQLNTDEQKAEGQLPLKQEYEENIFWRCLYRPVTLSHISSEREVNNICFHRGLHISQCDSHFFPSKSISLSHLLRMPGRHQMF